MSRLFACLLFAGCAVSRGVVGDRTGGPWEQLALLDLEEMRRELRESHPGFADPDNTEFLRADSEGHLAALALAKQVRSLDGYAAALQRYAGAFRDGHLYVTTPTNRQPGRWPGLVIGYRAGRFIVTESDQDGGLPPAGSELLTCDHRSPAEIVRHEVFPFFGGDERREASWIRLSPRLLDPGNPFRNPLRRCAFRSAGKTAEVPLTWRTIGRDQLAGKWRAAAYGERPAADIRSFSERGVWATLSAFTPDLVKRALAERAAWAGKSVIVLDVRGNTGGSSIWGYQLLATFLGSAPTRPPPLPYDEWRVSAGNLTYIETQLVPGVSKIYGDDSRVLRELRRIGAGMRAAMARGQPLYRHDVDFAAPEAAAEDVARTVGVLQPVPGARVFLVTDGRCVSACLDFVDQALRYPGVVQVGLATDADSPYTEVRSDIPLPSGLSSLGMAMTVYRVRPRDWKPFLPQHVFTGDISDTAAVEHWLTALICPND